MIFSKIGLKSMIAGDEPDREHSENEKEPKRSQKKQKMGRE